MKTFDRKRHRVVHAAAYAADIEGLLAPNGDPRATVRPLRLPEAPVRGHGGVFYPGERRHGLALARVRQSSPPA